jgi:hypothetical protein
MLLSGHLRSPSSYSIRQLLTSSPHSHINIREYEYSLLLHSHQRSTDFLALVMPSFDKPSVLTFQNNKITYKTTSEKKKDEIIIAGRPITQGKSATSNVPDAYLYSQPEGAALSTFYGYRPDLPTIPDDGLTIQGIFIHVCKIEEDPDDSLLSGTKAQPLGNMLRTSASTTQRGRSSLFS